MKVYSIIGLNWGDESKGATIDYLSRRHSDSGKQLGIKVAGGCQAAHRVVTLSGKSFVFQQLSAASFNAVDTFIGPEFVVDLAALQVEWEAFYQATGLRIRVIVHPSCPIVTPLDVAASLNDHAKSGHGTTGRGVGAARLRNFRVADYLSDHTLFEDHPKWIQACSAALNNEFIKVGFMSSADIYLCESSQGVLLDQTWGMFPYVTRSDVTHDPAIRLFKSSTGRFDAKSFVKVGCVRSYSHRHGPGPLPGEGKHPEFEMLVATEAENHDDPVIGQWRVGLFDLALTEYAIATTGGVDVLALSHLDVSPRKSKVMIGAQTSVDEIDLVDWAVGRANQSVIGGFGPNERQYLYG